MAHNDVKNNQFIWFGDMYKLNDFNQAALLPSCEEVENDDGKVRECRPTFVHTTLVLTQLCFYCVIHFHPNRAGKDLCIG